MPAALPWRYRIRSVAPASPEELDARADVSIEPKNGGFAITKSRLTLQARILGIDQAKFKELAEQAKANCPVSKALARSRFRWTPSWSDPKLRFQCSTIERR